MESLKKLVIKPMMRSIIESLIKLVRKSMMRSIKEPHI